MHAQFRDSFKRFDIANHSLCSEVLVQSNQMQGLAPCAQSMYFLVYSHLFRPSIQAELITRYLQCPGFSEVCVKQDKTKALPDHGVLRLAFCFLTGKLLAISREHVAGKWVCCGFDQRWTMSASKTSTPSSFRPRRAQTEPQIAPRFT